MMPRSAAVPLLLTASLVLAACTTNGSATPAPAASGAPAAADASQPGDGSSNPASEPGPRTYRIVTLGDTYTYGTGTDAPARDSWPAQMRAALRQRAGMRIYLRNLAWPSSPSVEIIEDQLPEVDGHEPDIVTLQVGVDDIVSGDTELYAENIAHILDELQLIVPPERIFVITTPDHTLTEWGKAYGPPEVVASLNADLVEAAEARGITVIDIAPINERVAVDPSLLVQADPPRPHPTAKQYAGWAELIGPYVHDALETIDA